MRLLQDSKHLTDICKVMYEYGMFVIGLHGLYGFPGCVALPRRPINAKASSSDTDSEANENDANSNLGH